MIKKLLFVGAMIFSVMGAMDESRLLCPKGLETREFDDNIKRSCFLTDKRDLPEDKKRKSRMLFLLNHDLRRMKKQEAGEQLKFGRLIKEVSDEANNSIAKLAELTRLVIQQRQIMQGHRY